MKEKVIAALFGLLAFFICLTISQQSEGPFTPSRVAPAPRSKKRVVAEDIKVYSSLSYGEHTRNTLDIYTPSGDVNAPVLFFCHGGGWSSGDKSMYGHIGTHFAKHGFCAVVINHRLSPEVKHPEHTIDAAKAFAWVKQNINQYGGNPQTINLMGHSSGAHITALLCSDPAYLRNVGCDPKEVHRYVGVSGVYKIDLMITLSGYGHVFDKCDRTAASPAHFVPACPCFLVYGEKDYNTMPRQTRAFEDQIRHHQGPVRVMVAPGETHESIIINACICDKPYVNAILDFLRE